MTSINVNAGNTKASIDFDRSNEPSTEGMTQLEKFASQKGPLDFLQDKLSDVSDQADQAMVKESGVEQQLDPVPTGSMGSLQEKLTNVLNVAMAAARNGTPIGEIVDNAINESMDFIESASTPAGQNQIILDGEIYEVPGGTTSLTAQDGKVLADGMVLKPTSSIDDFVDPESAEGLGLAEEAKENVGQQSTEGQSSRGPMDYLQEKLTDVLNESMAKRREGTQPGEVVDDAIAEAMNLIESTTNPIAGQNQVTLNDAVYEVPEGTTSVTVQDGEVLADGEVLEPITSNEDNPIYDNPLHDKPSAVDLSSLFGTSSLDSGMDISREPVDAGFDMTNNVESSQDVDVNDPTFAPVENINDPTDPVNIEYEVDQSQNK